MVWTESKVYCVCKRQFMKTKLIQVRDPNCQLAKSRKWGKRKARI